MVKRLTLIAAIASLTACSSAPSDADINAAVQKSIEQTNQQVAAAGAQLGEIGKGMADAFKVEAPTVKKVGCKADGEKAYICDVEITSKLGTKVGPIRFVKSSDGWAIAG